MPTAALQKAEASGKIPSWVKHHYQMRVGSWSALAEKANVEWNLFADQVPFLEWHDLSRIAVSGIFMVGMHATGCPDQSTTPEMILDLQDFSSIHDRFSLFHCLGSECVICVIPLTSSP